MVSNASTIVQAAFRAAREPLQVATAGFTTDGAAIPAAPIPKIMDGYAFTTAQAGSQAKAAALVVARFRLGSSPKLLT